MNRAFQTKQRVGVLSKLVKFLLVGSSGVLVNTAVLFLFYQVVGFPLVVASAIAVETAIVHNFFWNDRWTFGEDNTSFRRFLKFNLVSLGGLVITTGVLTALVVFARFNYLLANLMAISVATLWNFGLSMFWTWS